MNVNVKTWDGTIMTRDVKFMCPKCFRVYKTDINKYCEDCKKKLFDVDSEIVDIVQLLNKKGYKTVSSCAGHCYRFKGESGLQEYDYKTPYIGLSFDEDYDYRNILFHFPSIATLDISPSEEYYPVPKNEDSIENWNEFLKTDKNFHKVLYIRMNAYFDDSECFNLRKGIDTVKKSIFEKRCKLFRKKIYTWAESLSDTKKEESVKDLVKERLKSVTKKISKEN